MSMYSELLAAAMAGNVGEASASPGELLAEVLRLRSRLPHNHQRFGHDGGRGDVHGRIADQLAYDVALLHLCASLGVAHDPRWFERPDRERSRLEEELVARGVALDAAV